MKPPSRQKLGQTEMNKTNKRMEASSPLKNNKPTAMKKLTNSVSPFLMLLLPMFLIVGLLLINLEKEIPAEKYNASLNLQVPSFKELVQNIF